MDIQRADQVTWDVETDVVIAGAGGCGMTAALAAAQGGAQVLLLEKMRRPGGNTALSTGMIPAAGTRFQHEAGVEDGPAIMAQDILDKNGYTSDPHMTRHLCRQSAELVDWLAGDVGVELVLVTDFLYPGHSRHRMHVPPARTGADLARQLWQAVQRDERIHSVFETPVEGLIVDDESAVVGVVTKRSGPSTPRQAQGDTSASGTAEHVRCRRLILATDGFGGNREMVARFCPEILDGVYFGSDGNTGDGVRWGVALDAATENMDAYQGHGSVSHPHGTLVTWAVVINGGFLVNRAGRRFGDESEGYSSYAVKVLNQPDGLAYVVFDERVYKAAMEFKDFQDGVEAGAVRCAETIDELARVMQVDPEGLCETLEAYNRAVRSSRDEFGRTDFSEPLRSPFFGVRVTGALFHTQGGLKVDQHARVLRVDGTPIPNLYAGGGAAVGVSGTGSAGYMAGNGLLAALGLGKLAGQHAAKAVKREAQVKYTSPSDNR
jgi:fumarate reductase flavoprotein subunit